MKKNIIRFFVLFSGLILTSACQRGHDNSLKGPNIILILVDDLGYGDLSCYNPDSKIKTPNLDKLARQGISFTDAHSSASQCSPTRYALMTGRYSWRTGLKSGVLPHFAQPLIDEGRITLASLLKQAGYATACIGKWHLGLGWQPLEGESIDFDSWAGTQNLRIDYTKPLTSSPNNYGFDYFFGINASNNMLPYCLIENNSVVTVPDKLKYPVFDTEDGNGLVSNDYDSEKLEQILFSKAMNWLDIHHEIKPDQPFFLYYPMSAIHRPCLPTDKFKNASQAGLRGNKVVEMDYLVGELMDWLSEKKIDKNTLFIFTSDNGARPGDQMSVLRQLASADYGISYNTLNMIRQDSLLSINNPYNKPKGAETYHIYRHFSSGPFKGYKSDIYEGGHRVPLIIRWPGVSSPGEISDELVCTIDLMATFAELLQIKLPENAGEDSYSFLPLILGKNNYTPRPNLVHKAWRYNKLAIRKGDWKLIPFRNGGGLYKFPDVEEDGQLYNIREDPGERINLYNTRPEIVEELEKELHLVINNNKSFE